MRLPPLKIKIMLESNPLKSRNLSPEVVVVVAEVVVVVVVVDWPYVRTPQGGGVATFVATPPGIPYVL